MKNVKKLLLFALLSLQINTSQASDSSDDSCNTSLNSGTSCVETVGSDDGAIKYFTEKLDVNGQTEYFDSLLVFPAKINKSFPWIKKTLTLIDPKTQEKYVVPMKDFIQCSGPIRSLTPAEYVSLVQRYDTN